ncbi:MAG: HD-GYP domain-containing protein [Phycisphaerales bacterium JB040]
MDSSRVQALVAQIEDRDLSTAAHTWRVVLYTRALAERFHVDDELMHQLTLGAALHDVGKLDIPIDILQKPGRLTEDEYETIKLHTVAGFARLVHMGVEEEPILDLVRYHHERWDGLGYPFGLKGELIPLPARYFAVIDSFDAMTSLRPYRTEVGLDAGERAADELERGSGSLYWPPAVEAFVALYRSSALDWIMRYYNDEAAPTAYRANGLPNLSEDRRHLPDAQSRSE